MKYDAGADAYDRLTGRWSRLYAAAVLDSAGIAQGLAVLDVATGTGDAALLASQRLQATGTVIGVDISVPMLRVAEAKSSAANLHFVAANAMMLPFRDDFFDAVICQFGLMFFPDRTGALAEIRRLLRPGGRVALTAWGPPDRAPFAGLMAEELGKVLPADRDELLLPFALADPVQLKQLLTAAGFRHNQVTRQIHSAHFESRDDFLGPFEQGGGRLGQAYLHLPSDERTAVRQSVINRLAEFATTNEELNMDVEAYIASGVA